MAKDDTQTTQQTQSSVTTPYAAAQPLLQGLIDKYGKANTDVTGAQTSALDNLSSGASAIPNFGSQGASAVGDFFGANTTPQVGMLSDAYKSLQGNIGGTASGAELDPYSTPGFADSLKTLTNDITNQVKGVYAGAGRDPSGAGSFAGSLGRGLTQGEAPVIAAQYNQNKGNQLAAANTLYGAGNTTAGGITAQQMAELTAQGQGLGLLPQLSAAYTAPGQAQVGAANAQYSQPYANLLQLLQPGAALGAMGSQSTGTGTSTTTQPQSTFGNILGGLAGGTGILSSMGAFGPAGFLALSDERLKENIEEIGTTHDDQKIYRYEYVDSPVTHIGMLAQEVQKRTPGAVAEMMPGILGVNYRAATNRAAAMRKAA